MSPVSKSRRPGWLRLILAVLGLSTGAGRAQAPADPTLVADYRAAAELVLIQNPLTAAAMRVAGYEMVVWGEVSFGGDRAPELDARLLVDIKDGKPMPRLVGIPKNEIPREDTAMYLAYSDALAKAFHTPLDAFRKSAEEHRTVTFGHLWRTPDRYRGKVVTVRGWLVMVRREEPPIPAKQRGVKDLYEGWVFGQTRGSNPYCIIFPVLPEGLQEAEEMRREVTFHGYFLTKFKYRGKKEDLVTPLLIGPTVVLEGANAAGDSAEYPYTFYLLQFILGSIVALIAVSLLIHVWFRRGDRRVHSTLAQIQARHNSPGFVNEEPPGAASPPLALPVPEPPTSDRPPDPPSDGSDRK